MLKIHQESPWHVLLLIWISTWQALYAIMNLYNSLKEKVFTLWHGKNSWKLFQKQDELPMLQLANILSYM